MKSVVCASLAALLLAIFVLPSLSSAANDGPSASGNFQFTLEEDGQARNLEFHARIQNNGRTVGEMTFSDPAAVPVFDPDDPGAIANTGAIITAKFDCLQITGKQAVMSGIISQSVTTEIHNDARQRSSLIGAQVGNDFAPDTSALSRSANSDKKGDYCSEGPRYSLIHAR